MTKKDYQLIAEVLRKTFNEGAWCMDNESDRKAMLSRFANALSGDNPKFDAAKFKAAVMKDDTTR